MGHVCLADHTCLQVVGMRQVGRTGVSWHRNFCPNEELSVEKVNVFDMRVHHIDHHVFCVVAAIVIVAGKCCDSGVESSHDVVDCFLT